MDANFAFCRQVPVSLRSQIDRMKNLNLIHPLKNVAMKKYKKIKSDRKDTSFVEVIF